MLHSKQPHMSHGRYFNNYHNNEQEEDMECQDVPLNLSRRGSQSNSLHNEKFEEMSQEKTSMRWSIIQTPCFLPGTESLPWLQCYPWQGYPFLPTHDKNFQYQQAYWQVISNILRERSRIEIAARQESVEAEDDLSIECQSSASETCHLQSPKIAKNENIFPQISNFQSRKISTESMLQHEGKKLTQKTRKASLSPSCIFKCTQCNAAYPHRFELNRHVKVSHIRPHRCEHCGKGFGHKNYLQVHIDTVHLGRKCYKCDLCGKYLSTGGNLSVHVKTIHMGEKKYKCTVCSRTFGQQCNMKTHMKRHFLRRQEKRAAENIKEE